MSSMYSVIVCTVTSCLILLYFIPMISSDTSTELPHVEPGILWGHHMQIMVSHFKDFLTSFLPISANVLWTVTVLVTVMMILISCKMICRPMNRTMMFGDIGYVPYTGLTMKEMSSVVKQQRLNGNTPPVYPNGWFAVLESRDLGQKEAKSVSCLGLHLAIFRGEDDRAHIIDAYCPHLGANLAVGGQVKGSCLECPFHGWRFNGDSGKCTHIPYADKIPAKTGVKSYICLERNNFIYIWYDAEGREPSWEPEVVEQIKSGDWVYRGRSEHIINTHIEEIPENGADVYHLQQVHSAFVTSGTDLRYTNLYHGKFLKHIWGGSWEAADNKAEKHLGILSLTHHATLFGYRVPKSDFNVTAKQIGPGIVYLIFHNFFFELCFLQSVTPLEPMLQRLIHQVYVKWYIPPVIGNILLWGEATQVDRDVMIWNNKRYNGKPVFVKSNEDSLLIRHRRWYSQFYSEHSPRLAGQQQEAETREVTDQDKPHPTTQQEREKEEKVVSEPQGIYMNGGQEMNHTEEAGTVKIQARKLKK